MDRMGGDENAFSGLTLKTGNWPENQHDPRCSGSGSDSGRKYQPLLPRRSVASDQWTSDAKMRSCQIDRFINSSFISIILSDIFHSLSSIVFTQFSPGDQDLNSRLMVLCINAVDR